MSKNRNSELAARRHARIAEILRRDRTAHVNELCATLAVSPATVRRDLLSMEQRGRLHRVHGGAVCVEGRLEEPLFDDKAALAEREKRRIARAALEFVRPTDSVFLDGGSTVLALARLLSEMPEVTVLTNSLRVAALFSGNGPRTIVVGGELRRRSQTFVGPLTEPLLRQLHVDIAFLGTMGLSAKEGMTTTDPREAQTKSLVMTLAQRVVLLVDGTKVGKVSFVRFGSFADLDTLITDAGADRRILNRLRRAGIAVVAV